jgi:coatomer subunit beta'
MNTSSMDERVFHDEVDITMKAAHKYTVRLIGHCYDTQMVPVQHEGKTIFAEAREMLICTEYVPNGTLYQYITGKIDM